MRVRFPQSVALELTYRCNHQCLFCSCPWYAPGSTYPKGKELTVDEWKSAIDRLYDCGVEVFSISGGEALLKEGLDDILRHIRASGAARGLDNEMLVISNGRLMNEAWLDLFKELNVHLSMSLPGYETFKAHTGVDNADGVLHWFNVAREKGIKTTVNITVTQLNYHELFKTISLGLINGATTILLNRFLPGGRGLIHKDQLALTAQQVKGMVDTGEEVLTIANRYGSVGTEIPMCVVGDATAYHYLQIGYRCAAAKGFFVVGPSGEIRTCNHSPHIVGHIMDDDPVSDTDYWNLFAESRYKPSDCKGCKQMSKCDCGCREVAHILTGDPCNVDCSVPIKQF